jgi:hypothetical protein
MVGRTLGGPLDNPSQKLDTLVMRQQKTPAQGRGFSWTRVRLVDRKPIASQFDKFVDVLDIICFFEKQIHFGLCQFLFLTGFENPTDEHIFVALAEIDDNFGMLNCICHYEYS